MKDKVIFVDIDGTLCSQTQSDYKNAIPFPEAIKKVNELYDKGNKIIIYTARFMSRTNNDVKKVNEIGYKFTFDQLKSWGLKFHELKMGKPQFHLIIDDRSYNYKNSWTQLL
ncbi:MAG: HAD hydrolase family protein [Pelagibacterales bacterium]|nr:HAD hydrolase family protein [Pelagibacterales bacterium]